jgi:hypothetical protein
MFIYLFICQIALREEPGLSGGNPAIPLNPASQMFLCETDLPLRPWWGLPNHTELVQGAHSVHGMASFEERTRLPTDTFQLWNTGDHFAYQLRMCRQAVANGSFRNVLTMISFT